ncbi:MAG: hypothetical protein B0D96_13275 [Candidatus Sedimenticola endophacoides]|uniref:23S rRNA (Guanine(745)-N(1))-methyltransferase n=1 Tax=Candidatus Sedimenticola endophacoides TaxID=2548426 RepID=A0A657PML7_9GAMM|nr:MAG: hypothetical protein B0D96_13275 [Candidatus Sedimenticola endophacoides]OQX32783.1 MAG: hypothetical protein B0D84_05650 [Candidatus Sedimenticola endophacoides]OQX42771.1 MAG: hypothetical protein B0D89_00555 [Candidatus Sedimenticola endophacoides]PUD98532.1 MAG: 23S rRNA (guanine(745)-N(1))-methyltransferase [Candidatus Sedimenticola endophacoides]PUE01624.1 MAG: 23S rRNA (guanine(745)-N(1))-methyltransferase [Candidatus Sedimenticola endophacoides]
MPISITPAWTCPICHAPLKLHHRSFRCAANHCFDQAREGYVNLLPSHHRHSAQPGDDRAMITNRRAFLEQGHYRPLAERLGDLCREHAAGRDHWHLLDSGCGEGYYSGLIAHLLEAENPLLQLQVSGVDISKEAVRLAARRHRAIHFAVASNASLPLADAGVDCLLQVFAPGYESEITRLLRPGGLYLRVSPGSHHLYRLREMVYDRPRLHDPLPAEVAGLRYLQHQELRFELHLTQPGDAGRLLAMTPYYWQASRQKQERIADLEHLRTEAHFRIDCFGADPYQFSASSSK